MYKRQLDYWPLKRFQGVQTSFDGIFPLKGSANRSVWMRLLLEIPDSVLWLLQDNDDAPPNLRREAQRAGVDPQRLVFAPRVPVEDHLARHRRADLFLDTLPCNAHTTASDALWAGLPVLTCVGGSFAGRVGATLLNAVGLPELVTRTLDEYASRALELASDPDRLTGLRRRLAANRLTHPLFDTRRFCSHLEMAYSAMLGRHRQGLAPESFSIIPLPPHPVVASQVVTET